MMRNKKRYQCYDNEDRCQYQPQLDRHRPAEPFKVNIKQQQTALNCNRVREHPE